MIENEAIEVAGISATYYLKNGKHYLVYEEVVSKELPGVMSRTELRLTEMNV